MNVFEERSLYFQSLPRIDLDNYSALPVDEGDEDREAGIGDEELLRVPPVPPLT